MPNGVYPEVRMTIAPEFQEYIRKHVQITFDGIEDTNGFIGQITDEFTEEVDQVITPDNIVTINGYGLKVACEAGNGYSSHTNFFEGWFFLTERSARSEK